MPDRSPRPISPLVDALAAALREVEERQAAERSERRRRLAVVKPAKTEAA